MKVCFGRKVRGWIASWKMTWPFTPIGSRVKGRDRSAVFPLDQESLNMINQQTCINANQPVGGWLEGLWYLQPIRVQALVLAFIPGFISGFSAMRIHWEETFLSTTRCLWWLRKFQDDMPAQFFGDAHRSRMACVRSYGWVYARVYERLCLYWC